MAMIPTPRTAHNVKEPTVDIRLLEILNEVLQEKGYAVGIATAGSQELAGQPILSRAVGLRPVRPTIRIERVVGRGIPIISAYGHGGAGVTLSWRTARRVRALVDDALG
jgi:hypothetical protein